MHERRLDAVRRLTGCVKMIGCLYGHTVIGADEGLKLSNFPDQRAEWTPPPLHAECMGGRSLRLFGFLAACLFKSSNPLRKANSLTLHLTLPSLLTLVLALCPHIHYQ